MPDDMDASVAAMSLLGLSRLAGRRLGETASDISPASRAAELDAFNSISYKRIDVYCRFAEQLIQEEYSGRYLPVCPNCETESIVDDHCEVCFEDMESIECPASGEQVYFPAWQRHAREHGEVECPHCGTSHVVSSRRRS
jgi:ribosomal protein S27E